MLQHLILKNLILIDSCEISFKKGLNIVSGETGAGKTALIQAISLSLGERADSGLIRKGTDKAIIEAAFDISHIKEVHDLLHEAGIDFDKDEYLIIGREIVRDGKNRAFINCRMAPLPLIQKIGAYLIDLIEQHTHHKLRTSDYQRFILDLFADLNGDVRHFLQLWNTEKSLARELEELKEKQMSRTREIAIYERELQEIDEAALKSGEEEALFEEYQRLSNVEELSSKTQLIADHLCNSLLPQLHRYKNSCEGLCHIDQSLQEPSDLIKSACIELDEASSILSSYLSRLENNPKRLLQLETRLKLIDNLKQKFGKTFTEIEEYRKNTANKLSQLKNLDEEIEKIEKELSIAASLTKERAASLSLKRKDAAKHLSLALTKELRDLNMPDAHLTISVEPASRSQTGEDSINFYLTANKGEASSLVKDSTSGGELSRLMLAIKATLSEKNNTPTIIFDEIDANVGGETATLIGEMLHDLGKVRQVLCITHFPQVACKADHHLRVSKEEVDGRTLANITVLGKQERQKELLRMLGGKKTTLFA